MARRGEGLRHAAQNHRRVTGGAPDRRGKWGVPIFAIPPQGSGVGQRLERWIGSVDSARGRLFEIEDGGTRVRLRL